MSLTDNYSEGETGLAAKQAEIRKLGKTIINSIQYLQYGRKWDKTGG